MNMYVCDINYRTRLFSRKRKCAIVTSTSHSGIQAQPNSNKRWQKTPEANHPFFIIIKLLLRSNSSSLKWSKRIPRNARFLNWAFVFHFPILLLLYVSSLLVKEKFFSRTPRNWNQLLGNPTMETFISKSFDLKIFLIFS